MEGLACIPLHMSLSVEERLGRDISYCVYFLFLTLKFSELFF